MDTFTMQFIDDNYYQYLKYLLIAGESKRPIPDHEVAMLRGHITLDEAFLLGMLCHG